MEQDLGVSLVGAPRRLLHVDRFRSHDLAKVYLRVWRGNDWKVGPWNGRAVCDGWDILRVHVLYLVAGDEGTAGPELLKVG